MDVTKIILEVQEVDGGYEIHINDEDGPFAKVYNRYLADALSNSYPYIENLAFGPGTSADYERLNDAHAS